MPRRPARQTVDCNWRPWPRAEPGLFKSELISSTSLHKMLIDDFLRCKAFLALPVCRVNTTTQITSYALPSVPGLDMFVLAQNMYKSKLLVPRTA